MILILAIIALVLAHYVKVYRLKQFILVYEKPNDKNLLQALSLGYIINFIFPFRIGDLFRAIYASRKMKNGFSFSLATIIIDRILDILVIAILFIIFYIIGFKNEVITNSISFYVIGAFLLILLLFLALKFSKYVKIVIKKIASIFNEQIELKILKFSWYIITAFKDMIYKLNKIKLFFSTIIMWLLYLTSYALFAYFVSSSINQVHLVDVFTSLFSKNNLDLSTISININNIDSLIIMIYLFVPLIILIILSLIPFKSNNKKYSDNKYLELLPQVNAHDKLIFLEGYFSAKSREYFNTYIALNRDISIIQDFSAGSNATTMLCSDNKNTFFRKYSFGEDSKKLYDQVKWLEEHKNILPVTQVMNVKYSNLYCSYDMPYSPGILGCFNYVHSLTLNKAWSTLKAIVDSLDKLHNTNVRESNIESIYKYIDTKVINNIKKIESSIYIKSLLKYDYLIINGKKYHNLNYFYKYLSKEYLKEVFISDYYSDIHGDFTIENIICITNKLKNNFYIIDPNTSNIHESPNLDYAKLLQSLHGGYEFLVNTKSVEVTQNTINYLFTKSHVYCELYDKYKDYLFKKFDDKTLKSIYYHEAIHWLRLMPYKLEKNKERSVLFYAGLIIVLNDIIDMWGE